MAPLRKKLKTDHISSNDDNDDDELLSPSALEVAISSAIEEDGLMSAEEEDTDAGEEEEEEEEDEEDDEDQDMEGEQDSIVDDFAEEEDNAGNGVLSDDSSKHITSNGTRGTIRLKQRAKDAQHLSRSEHTLVNGNNVAVQIDRLLRQTKPQHTQREVEAETVLHALRKTIEAIPSVGPFSLSDAHRALREQHISIPFPDPQPSADSNLKFAYARPESMNVVGSYPTKTASRSRKFLYVDMVVQMPESLFQEKDYTNYRYFYKRAFYLACLASAIKIAHGDSLDIRFQDHHDDPLRPIITIRSSGVQKGLESKEASNNWQINILPSISASLFLSAKLMPGKLSIRRKDESSATASSAAQNARYNSSLRGDMLVTEYLKLLHKTSTSCEAYRDACALGSMWLRQRGFRATYRKGGFASFEWAALTALLLQPSTAGDKALIGTHFTSLQIFKTVLHLLATRDLIKHPLVVGSDVPSAELATSSGPVVWDGLRAHNLLYKVPIWSFRRLQNEAKTTLAALGDPDFDGFQTSFNMKKDGALLGYDFVVKIDGFGLADTDHLNACTQLYRTLKQGLGNRVTQIDISIDRSKAWYVKTARHSRKDPDQVRVGVIVNPQTVNRTVDHGPAAEDKDAATAFRAFWGDKAELRRFKDGSILEALVWESDNSKPPILEQIIQHLLHKHFGSTVAENTSFTTDAYGRMLGHHDTVFRPASREPFKKLEADIRNLQDLPLPIRQIVLAQSVGESFQSTTLRPKTRDYADVVMQFESSGKWPDELAAIQRTKLAFLVNIGELLQDAVDTLHATIGLENEGHGILNQGFLDIVYPASAAFRLRIFHDREQTLLERILKDKTSHARLVELTAQALATYKREYLKRPAHAQALLQLTSHYPALRGTIALLKRWFASHLLSNHINAELIELFAAYTFTRPWPWQSPTSVQTGFLRTIVWLSRFDWRIEPLIVDLSTDRKLTSDQRKAIRSRFEAWRKLDPVMNKVAVFAASSVDPDGTTYSTERPSKVIAGRMTALARAAAGEIESQDLQLSPQSLFSSSLMDFDFVLHLAPQYASHTVKRGSKGRPFKNLELSAAADLTDSGARPAQDFLEELETLYGSAILFMSGLPDRAIIAGLWTPQTAERTWKVNLAYSTVPVRDDARSETHARINATAVLAEISRLGGELIERIELPKETP